MLAGRISCPRCGLTLTVSERAPRHISCPRCLALLINPASAAADASAPPAFPIPVLPLDRQVERDARISQWLVIALLALLFFAGAVTFAWGDRVAALFVVLLMAALGVFAALSGGTRASVTKAPAEAGIPPPIITPGGTTVLEYGTPRRPDMPRASAGAMAAGFFSAIGVCALGFVVLAATAQGFDHAGHSGPNYGNALVLAFVVIGVMAYIVVTVRYAGAWRGFGPGATVGLVLGLLALGPCAACYLMTLGG